MKRRFLPGQVTPGHEQASARTRAGTRAASPPAKLVARDGAQISRHKGNAVFELRGMTVAYDRGPVIWNVDFAPPQGQLTAIVGPNGGGKSTLLKASVGLIARLAGRITLDGAPLRGAGQAIAYMPQRSAVDWSFPVTALDVVTMGLYRKIGWLRWPGRTHRKIACDCLDAVGMADFAARQIGRLSGGQQQRIFLARALAQDARILLMDEPFASVDAATEDMIYTTLRRLAGEGRTIVAVHHDIPAVRRVFDQVVLLNGTVIASGAAHDILSGDMVERAYGHLPGSVVMAGAGGGAGTGGPRGAAVLPA